MPIGMVAEVPTSLNAATILDSRRDKSWKWRTTITQAMVVWAETKANRPTAIIPRPWLGILGREPAQPNAVDRTVPRVRLHKQLHVGPRVEA
jgi:hypothetical protein